MDKDTVNRQYFGHDTFRPGQGKLIDAILSGQDSLGIMPTGGGKSLCYQVPALMLSGLTLVISPLISLMKDQVAALQKAGIPAAFLNSSLESGEYRRICCGVQERAYKLLYIAPERLDNEKFAQLIGGQELSLVAVDEAHCISQWGQDFRPSYLKIPDFLNRLPTRPVLAAFTATATADVRKDIIRLLRLRNPAVLVTGFDRPNLSFEVRKPGNRAAELTALVKARRGQSGIVYCATRAKVETICDQLNAAGVSATRYHAGLTEEERRQNQDAFQFDQKSVMVATNAFGMGIDKSNVSFVIHYNMPKSLEAYYQEAGRAGRDGEPAECILLFSSGDILTAKYLIENGGENEELSGEEREAVRRQDYQRLDAMIGYCKTTMCLRGYILSYFGQDHPESCGNCGNCRSTYTLENITVQTQMILSCVKRIKDKLGYYVGSALVVRVLRGSRDQRIRQLGLDQLTTYGIMGRLSRAAIQQYVDYLEQEGYLRTNPQYRTLYPTERAGNVLYRGEEVEMPVKAEGRLRTSDPEQETCPEEPELIEHAELFERLKEVRTRLAQEENVPPYIVFSNASLRDMARRAPRTNAEFLEVSGVGEVKAARYGTAFLEAVRTYLEERRG